jgi:hypothetical protein
VPRLVPALLAAVALAGCGAGGGRTPSLGGLPLAPRAQVAATHRVCNTGAEAFCALQVVVVARGYRTSLNLLGAERGLLRRHGWAPANAPEGLERAADSPGDKLRVTYATASGDLQGVDLGWIRRSREVTLALSHAMLAHTPALSIVLEVGTA